MRAFLMPNRGQLSWQHCQTLIASFLAAHKYFILATHYPLMIMQIINTVTFPYISNISTSDLASQPSIAMSANFSDLPAELVEMVAWYSEPTALKSLRIVSRGISASVLRPYCQTFFRRHSLLLCDDQSLENSMAMTQHPEFRRSLETLSIFIDGLAVKEQRENEIVCPFTIWERNSLIRQEERRKCNMDLHYLTYIFANLQGINDQVKVQIVSSRASKLAGAATLPKQLATYRNHCRPDSTTFGAPDAEDPRSFDVVMEALARSHLRVRDIRMIVTEPKCTACYTWPYEHSWALPLHLTTCSPATLAYSLRHVQQLSLTFRVNWSEQNGTMTFSKLRKILCGLPQLKKLYLKHEDHQVWEVSDAMLTEFLSSTMPQLRHLVLDSVDIHLSELRGFVLRHPLLERLDLVGTALLEDSLDTIVVDDLYTRFQAYWNDPDLESAKSYELHKGLAKAIRDMIGCPGIFSTLFIADLVIEDDYSSVMVSDGEIQGF